MIRNRNGMWMDPRFAGLMKLNLQQFAEGDGEGGNGGDPAGEAGNNAGDGENGGNQGDNGPDKETDSVEDLKAQIAKLQAAAEKQKAALDRATHEAAESKKALKAKQTQEEIDADAKREAEEKRQQEFEELQRKVARAENTKAIMGKLGVTEEVAGQLAESLRGCENIENALLLIQKEWTAKEKSLRMEFGKVTPPGAGADPNSPEAQAVARAKQIGKDRAAVNDQANKALKAYLR